MIVGSSANGREHEQARDPLRQRAVDPDPPAAGPAGIHRDRQVLAFVFQAHPHPLERAQERADRAPAEIALADES